MKKIAVVMPGIGYHKDKPLLYYSAKLAGMNGYDIVNIEYHDMPQKIRGNAEMMRKAGELACAQSEEQLAHVDFEVYDEILFIGKSIGTVALARYVSDHGIKAKQIWYTPVEATFSYDSSDVLAFIGDSDPWSDVDRLKEKAKSMGIRLYSYPDCNHSLETGDVDTDIMNLRDVMEKTRVIVQHGSGEQLQTKSALG